jgi:hypothetical protein
MKRPICCKLAAMLAATLAVGACSSPEQTPAAATTETVSEWSATPSITAVTRDARRLQVSGVTEPQGRVVLRAADSRAYATGSDRNGRFALAMPWPAVDALFVVEGQRGEFAARAPYELLVPHDASGPVALLAEGAPTRRLDPAGPLDAIDSDGHALIASGRAAPRTTVEIRLDGRPAFPAPVGADGRWSAVLRTEGAGATSLSVGGRRYDYPGPGDAAQPLVANTGGGWRVTRRMDAASWQSSWLPAG